MRTDRLQALCDGVFAIAATLLVLDLPVPEDSRHLARDLLDQWPSYAAYVVSFVTIGVIWINHHALMDRVLAADRVLLWLNLLLLLCVGLVPWPTRLVATYLDAADEASAAAVVYGIVMFLLSGSFTLIWLWLQRRNDLAHPDARPRIGAAIRRSLVGPGAYAVATLVALVSAGAAFVLFALAAGFFAVTGRGPRVQQAGLRRAPWPG